ncbi:retinoic acid-induced protein 1 [Pelobates fuscus]|uniref:retinoic acid-induced protein 1 n=1 Tax=Pelobates fuscus TaxID=191477 RepID=UPI002FE4B513
MQSFRERCGFHGNQQNYQSASQDSSRLENYRHQSQPALNCERQRQVTKGYYAQMSYQGYENNAGEKYPRGDKHINVQHLQGRVSFASFPEGSVYTGQYSGEEGLQNWSQSQTLAGTKYEGALVKKTSGEGRGYQDLSGQMQFRSHNLHHPQQPQQPQQQSLPYAKLPRQKVQNEVASSPLSFSQSTHFNQSYPTVSTYSSVPGSSQVSHSFKSCTAPSNPPHERAMATANQRAQAMHAYQSSRMASYEQPQRHHAQETLHYQNMAKYQHYSQQGQAYCQSETPSRTTEQYYQTFSPSASHSPARSVGRSPSYNSAPSPLMSNIENFQYSQQQHSASTFPMGISDHSHYMPLLNPSPTGTSSPDSQTKNLQNDKIPETLLSDLSLQSLTALTSQVENISNTVQQMLLSKSGIPQKKGLKTSPRTPEQIKGQHCSPDSNTYSADQIGTPLSETLGTPQSVHTEIQDADYLSGSEDQLERNYLYCGPGRSPGRANSNKIKPESISTCSVTSPDNMSTKSDDSFQSIHANLPLETFAKLVSSERECPHLLVNALSHEELSTEIIALQDAIDNEKAEKAWVDSPTLNNNSPKSPFNLENHTACSETAPKNTWSDQGPTEQFADDLKKHLQEKTQTANQKDFNDKYFEKEEFTPIPAKLTESTEDSVNFCSENNTSAVVSSTTCTSFSNTNTTCSKTTDPFDWSDKNESESCLRWKDIELTLRSSDLQKGLFQTKENKTDCHLDVPDVETPLENDSGEEFNKDGAEDLAYADDRKTDSEKWLEDTRDCYTGDDFNDIPDLPSQKESNLEPEDYSSLCDFSDRKSFIYDAPSPKQLRDMEAFSSINTPESIENPSSEGKENLVPSPQLSDGHSIILLGPAVGTESKVNSWFESTLSHIKTDEEIKKTNEDETEANTLEPAPIVEVEEHKLEDQSQQLKTEEELDRKPIYSKRNQCRISESKESDRGYQTQSDDTSAIGIEKIGKEDEEPKLPIPATKVPHVEETPARMCTRSLTSKVEPQAYGPVVGMKASLPEKLTKGGAFGVKQRAPFKPGRRGGKTAMKVMSLPSDQNAFIPQGKTPSTLPTSQKAKENVINILKDERSMILRSRSKNQELFQTKRRKGKRGMSLVLKKHTSLKKIIANNCTLPDTFKLMPKVKQRMKLSKPGVAINGKTTERTLHSLKRKPSFISPVPAKKRNLILRSKNVKEEKCEAATKLFKKIKPTKKEKVKLSIARKKTCKVILNTPSVRVTPDVCLKITSQPTYAENMKTKVLPPRKGRGLKLDAIVQKITSPNQKKQVGINTGSNCVSTPANSPLNVLDQGKDLRDSSIVSVDSEIKMLDQDLVKSELSKLDTEMHTLTCRRYKNKSIKGKLLHNKKMTTNSLLDEFGTHAVADVKRNCVGTNKLSAVSKKKITRGRSRGSSTTSKSEAKKLARANASVLLTPRDKALSENAVLSSRHQSSEYKQAKLKEGSPDESATQTRARKKTKHPIFNGYTKRQRKSSPRSKPPNQTTTSKRRSKGRNAPLITPKEPEIKLRYVSSKPTRTETRVRHFTPYIQVEKRNEFTTTCTIINTPGEETRLIKERNSEHSASPRVSLSSHGIVPFSSRMQLGPLVCKSVASGCLVCCLCRSPANYKDLGDLCGPYYPMDCLPNKKTRPKEKFKTEETPAEKSPKATENLCSAGSGKTPCLDGGAVDSIKHNNLRTSARGLLRKLPSCYCCNKKSEVSEVEKPRRHQCSKTADPPPPEPAAETQEHWVHEACAVWTSGVYLVAGKLYGIHEAIQMAASGPCPKCLKPGATVGCSHQGCTQTYHYTCAMETGCLLNEENFSIRCPKHKRLLV